MSSPLERPDASEWPTVEAVEKNLDNAVIAVAGERREAVQGRYRLSKMVEVVGVEPAPCEPQICT